MNIITKFTIATEQGVDTLLQLTKKIADEKFSDLLDHHIIEDYITENFNEQTLIADLNNMSNQFLVVYVDDKPAGYARITSKGKRPTVLENKRCIRIAGYGILQKYTEEAVRLSLFEKCMSVSKSYEGIWINELTESPLIAFFESKGFTKQEESFELDELPLSSACLIKLHV